MSRSFLRGRRIHIACSTADPSNGISPSEITRCGEFIGELVKELVLAGASFVIPVDAEKKHPDGSPICFDWLVWNTLLQNISLWPDGVDGPLAIAVKHHKNEDQIPSEYLPMWNVLKRSPRVQIRSAAKWNMNSKRMELQAENGDILIAIGGGEGVLFLANLYHDAGKPVIPLNIPVSPESSGARKLFEFALTGTNASKFFRTVGSLSPHTWLNRVEVDSRKSPSDAVRDVMSLLEALAPPEAFVVRLLNNKEPDFDDVDRYFSTVVQPVIESEMGYKMMVVDGKQAFEASTIDKDIFQKLHRASVVLVDITGLRPNCFIELGYALGRGIRTLLLAKNGITHPFDITTFAGHHWRTDVSHDQQKREFREHWAAVQNRPSIVPAETLMP